MSDFNSLKTSVTLSTMDEEKALSEGEQVEIGNDAEFVEATNNGHAIRRGLTEVSQMFDRNGKGYLDDTERALRRMDTQNKGYLGIDKVCVIFESLQAEQERSSKLLEALQVESRKTLNLKKGVIALTVFALLLALANVGTSFAVAQLVKETSVTVNGNMVATGTNKRVATTAKNPTYSMEPLDASQRRRLSEDHSRLLQNICDRVYDPTNSSVVISSSCTVVGTMTKSDAEDLYQEHLDTDVLLKCGNKRSLFTGMTTAPSKPAGYVEGLGMYAYPSSNTDIKYLAHQWVTEEDSSSCYAQFHPGMYCFEHDDSECLVMYYYDTKNQPNNCTAEPEICPPVM